MQRRLCVYTVLIGGYEELNAQPAAAASTLPFICLTDDPDLKSDTWDCRVVAPLFAMDAVRSQRDIKIRPHLYLPEFDGSVYIDNSVILLQPPERLWEQMDPQIGFLLPEHSDRETVLDEFMAVIKHGLDDGTRVLEQLNHYTLTHPEILQELPYIAGILVRLHAGERIRTMQEIWAAHVQRYSRRDQLSINMAFRLGGMTPQSLRIDNYHSEFHRWPEARHGTAQGPPPRDPLQGLYPATTRVKLLERETLGQRTAIEHLQAKFDHREQEVQTLRAQVQAIHSSTIWRATEPMRNLAERSPALARTARIVAKAGARVLRNTGKWARGLTSHSGRVGQAIGAHGTPIYVDLNDPRGRELIRARGNLNPTTLAIWQSLLRERPWTHVIDVGANYGEMLANGGLPKGARVLAIEPSPQVRPYLARTMQSLKGTQVLDVALSDREGKAALLIDPDWSGKTLLAKATDAPGAIEVRTTTLGALLDHDPQPASAMRVLVKIDVEGHEAAVLRGALDVLPELGDFAALVEIRHGDQAELAWIDRYFEVFARHLESGQLRPIERGGLPCLSQNSAFYAQDVVLRRRLPS